MNATRDEDCGLDLRVFERYGLVEAVDRVLGCAVCRAYRETEYSRY